MIINRSILLLLCLTLPAIRHHAQIAEGGKPYASFIRELKNTAALPKFPLKIMNVEQLLAEDALKPVPYRYAVFEPLVINIKNSGKSDLIPGKGKIWRLSIQSAQAKSMQILFTRFIVPDGARLFVYNENQTVIRGAYTRHNMQPDSALVLADFPGESLIVEYFEPENPEFEGEVITGHVSQAYRDILNELLSEDGYVNINCPEGKNAQLEKHAVCKITFRSDDVSYLCTGALINNARNDGTPYFLTAHHCISKADEASSMVAYFNYENAGCDGEALNPLTLTGANLLVTADSSDVTLLQLYTPPPAAAQPYFAGWDANDAVTDKVTGIHHPLGLTKKYSLDYDSIFSNPIEITWSSGSSFSPEGSHWIVQFDIGTTDGGSSGSPLFNAEKQIIGQLHGGSSNIDIYGKLSYSYANKPAGYPALQHYLDPDSTGILELNGYYPPDNPPDAYFTLDNQTVCLNAPVTFRNYSVFNPDEWQWIISPESYVFTDGTSASSPQPVLEFTQPGSYTITLTAGNSSGSDTMVIENGILAGDSIAVTVENYPAGNICLCDFNQIRLTASGGVSYSWTVHPDDVLKVELNKSSGDTVIVGTVSGYSSDAAYAFQIITIGRHGDCADTLLTDYEVLKPENDEIANAIPLSFGKSILYNNICATIEPGEPVPPYSSCTSQLSWCDEYGTGEDIVENSVWFTFVAPATGKVRVWSTGMDNQLAIYDAASAADILNGNYELIGANDDRTSTDYHPSIRSVDVIPGQTYWIQADGSGGGLEDEFYMHLYQVEATGLDDLQHNKLQVYPQPAFDVVYLKGDALAELTNIMLEVFNAGGILVFRENSEVRDNSVPVDVSSWESGVYLVRISTGKTVFSTRIIKF